ncbi:MAG TPA: primosomal protein N', partial [Tepidiformaceae bacterium]|nr:primosomal protein N' [Tepidiformaceae bacterium]
EVGLIVIDEEHEFSYKQSDPVPRYHARDAASELARLTGATLVLGSATPDIVTYHAAETGAISRVQLTERLQPLPDGDHQPGKLPRITVVDMRDELRIGNRSVFSFALRRAVNLALGAGEQSILFVNRRGSARFVLCRDCGFMPECPACRVTMSLDMRETIHARLVCHYCGRSRKLEDRCPRCDSARYRPFGVGTQRIELEAREQFPEARVARWDSDVAKHKGSHERMVAKLEAGEIDILVGTQMLAKGLDLPEMTVVGVVDADVGLGLPDYRAHERTFQLLSQVAGRAGRRARPGLVYFQTYQPEAPPIICAAEHDYRSFYEQEIAHRRLAAYPPFSRMLKLMYRNSNEEAALQEASRVAEEIRVARDAAGRWEPEVLGPTPAYVARIRGEYRFQLILRGRDPAVGLQGIRLGERWSVDVDPVSLL